ncbi:hypothetical protein ACFO0S_13920 [Chryseomicrobium palamuruense]|uniref:Type II secretion system protein n=1 Tax=Chryseomicrobium palamuruense TaxID=682973 RepID=A0ABV8UYL6_9BACL
MLRANDGYILLFVLTMILLVSTIIGGMTSSLLTKQTYYKSLEIVYNQKATAYWIVYTNKNDVE